MNRRQALAKATTTTADVAGGLLTPQQAQAFQWKIKDKGVLLSRMGFEMRSTDTGTVSMASVGSRIIRRATENSDDGYRAGMATSDKDYTAVKIRLPWEVTEDTFHVNIERERLEDSLTNQMTSQFAYDLEDLAVNGNTADVSADAPFLTIDDGILKMLAAGGSGAHVIDGSTINSGGFSKGHLFEALMTLPNKWRSQGGYYWLMSPLRAMSWWETLTDRTTAAGDALLTGQTAGPEAYAPLGVPILGSTGENGERQFGIPSWPDNTVVLARPKNFVRVVTWDIRKRRVTGETDATLAAKDKRFYVFFLKQDVIVNEFDEVVVINNLDPVA
jgi:hypothetical protein